MGGRLISWKGGGAMEVFQALQLMFLFGMFILALLAYLKKNRPPQDKESVYLLT
jgi:hypothetical protein